MGVRPLGSRNQEGVLTNYGTGRSSVLSTTRHPFNMAELRGCTHRSEDVDVLVACHQVGVLGSACGRLHLVSGQHPHLNSTVENAIKRSNVYCWLITSSTTRVLTCTMHASKLVVNALCPTRPCIYAGCVGQCRSLTLMPALRRISRVGLTSACS